MPLPDCLHFCNRQMPDTDLAAHDKKRPLLPWIILGFAAMNVIFLGGKRRAFGIFVAEFHHGDFKEISLAELNWIGDSYAALGYLTTTLSTTIILNYDRRYKLFQFIGSCFVLLACLTSAMVSSAHWLFLTHTVFHGIGSSLILSTIGLVVNEHFDKNHKFHLLATTLVSGGSIASIVFVQFYAALIEQYHWRKAFVILGFIYFVVNCSGSLVFTRNNNVVTTYKQNRCSLNWDEHITRRHVPLLVLWTLDRIFTTIVTYGMLLNLADYLRRTEKTLTDSTSLTILFAAGEASTYLIGAVITATTQDLFKNRLKYILLVCTGFMSAGLILWEFVSSMRFFCNILAFSTGFFLGPSITFLFPAGEEMTRLPGHLAYPFSLGGMGIGMLLSPTLSAVIATAFEYNGFFLIQGCLILLKFFCLLSLCILSNKVSETPASEYHRVSMSDREDDRDDLMNDSIKNGSLIINKDHENIKIRVR